jgi:phage terminase small subunit
MRKQQLVARALLLAVTLSVGAAYAGDGPAPGKGKPGDAEHAKGAPGKAEPGKAEPGKPDAKPAEAAAAPGKEKGDKDADKDKDGDKDRAGRGHRGMRELFDELKQGKLKKGELKDRLGELKEHRDDRAKEHREALKARFGAALATPAAKEELEHHARRMARLDRALVLAETEVTKDKDKLKDRIQKLIDKENTRHEAAMERFKSAGTPNAGAAAAAAPAAPTPGTPAAPAAAVAVEKTGDK